MKKRIVFVLIIVGSVFLFALSAYAGIDDGLMAYYQPNGNANGASDYGNNGTVQGSVLTTDGFGDLDNAYSFGGVYETS